MRIIDFGITLLFIYSHFCHNFITKFFSVSVYHACKSNTMERSHLCHLVMVAKFLEDNKPKKSLKEWICTVSSFIDLIQFHLTYYMLGNFLGLSPKGPYLSLVKRIWNFCVVFTYSINWAREIRRFHVTVVQEMYKQAWCMCKVVVLPIYM